MIIKNLLSMSSVNVVKSAVQFLITLLITYFVTPTEFGLVAFSLPFIAFISMLTDLGLSSAMIQRTSLTREEAGAATTLMVAIGIGCALLLAVMSKPLGAAVDMQGLPAVLAALSGSVVLSISAMGPRAVLERSLQYQTIALIEAGAALASATVGVVGALLGWGIWALIAYYVLMQAVRAVAFYVNTRRHIHLCFKWRGVALMLSFGGWVLASNVLNFAARNVGNLMIGAKLGAAAVGLFGLAFQFMTLPLMILSWPGGGVLMATLSRMNGDGEQERRKAAICAVLGMTAMITFPAMIYLTFGLKYPVAAFLSPHWQEVLPLIAILAPAGAAQSIAAYAGPILLAHDKARLQFWVSTANSASMILAFVVALPFGLISVAAVYLVVSILVCAFMLMIGARNCAVSYASLFGALMPATVATALGALCALVATSGDVASLSHWLIATAVYVLIVLGSYVVFRRRIWSSVQSLLGGSAPPVQANLPSAS